MKNKGIIKSIRKSSFSLLRILSTMLVLQGVTSKLIKHQSIQINYSHNSNTLAMKSNIKKIANHKATLEVISSKPFNTTKNFIF